MTEENIGFLFNAASTFAQSENNETHKKLKSYYLMRCKDLNRGYGFPNKHFSEKSGCSYCCLEWNNKCHEKLKPIKLSKRQRKRIRSNGKNKTSCKKECLLYSNEMERICSFCGKSMKTAVTKPNKTYKPIEQEYNNVVKDPVKPIITKEMIRFNRIIQRGGFCNTFVASEDKRIKIFTRLCYKAIMETVELKLKLLKLKMK